MQKVILLPRLPGFKLNLFIKRLVVISQLLKAASLETLKTVGVLWHEGVAGRKLRKLWLFKDSPNCLSEIKRLSKDIEKIDKSRNRFHIL